MEMLHGRRGECVRLLDVRKVRGALEDPQVAPGIWPAMNAASAGVGARDSFTVAISVASSTRIHRAAA
jgi:hypothetical protein